MGEYVLIALLLASIRNSAKEWRDIRVGPLQFAPGISRSIFV